MAAPGSRQLATDTYAVQHPGVPERRAVQSVCLHLISLCAALERDWPPGRAPTLLRRALARPGAWRWLDVSSPRGCVTVARAFDAPDPLERGRRVRAWAEDVWEAYSPHHHVIRVWLGAVVSS